MKFSLFLFALFSTTVFALGTNELTGTFGLKLGKVKPLKQNDGFLTGATSVERSEKSRAPASIDDTNKKISHVTELTGTFE
jgi:hypothetical protein